MKDFGVNVMQCIVDAVVKSQCEEMIEHAPEIEVDSGPSNVFYLSQSRDQLLNLVKILLARRCLALTILINCIGLKLSLPQL
jgi:hypothetical protein